MSESLLEYDGRTFTLPYGELIPPPNSEELSGLTESIREHGVLHQIYHTIDDVVISGSTRLVIAKSLGIPLAELPLKELATEDAEMLAIQLNTTGRKWPRERLVTLAHRLRHQSWSIRRIVSALGVSQGTVQNYLEESANDGGEPGVQNCTPEFSIGSDGKKYPASKPKPDDELDFGDGDKRPDVDSEEPTDDSDQGDATKPTKKKSSSSEPPTKKELLQKYNRHYSALVQIASALGKYQPFRELYQKLYDGTFETGL